MVSRRTFLGSGVAVAATFAIPFPANAANFYSGLTIQSIMDIPFFYALEKGLFRLVGLNVEPVKWNTSNLIANDADSIAIHTQCVDLIKQEVALPGQFKIIALSHETEPQRTDGAKSVDRNFGSAALIRTGFIKHQPEASQRYIAAYNLAINCLRENYTEAYTLLKKYGQLAEGLSLPEYTLYRDMSPLDIQSFQKHADYHHEVGDMSRKLNVEPLFLKHSDLI